MSHNPFAAQPDLEKPRNPFAARNPEYERPARPSINPFLADPFDSRSDHDVQYWTRVLLWEIDQRLNGGDGR